MHKIKRESFYLHLAFLLNLVLLRLIKKLKSPIILYISKVTLKLLSQAGLKHKLRNSCNCVKKIIKKGNFNLKI